MMEKSRKIEQNPSLVYETGETVLCCYGPLIYEAKIIQIKKQKKNFIYQVHYVGWNKSWDEWVNPGRLLKYTKKNIALQQRLQRNCPGSPKIRKTKITGLKPQKLLSNDGYEPLKEIHVPASKTLARTKNMDGFVKVIIFLIGIVVIPTILLGTPLYLKLKVFADIEFAVTESDVLEIRDGISSIFCQEHKLNMSSTFNAFQINGHTVNPNYRKHLRLRKSMSVPDDSLEYWGFFLNKGSTVNISLCSKFSGGRIMIVKDSKEFHTCGLLDRDQKKAVKPHFSEAQEVHIIYESNAEEVPADSNEGGENTDEALVEFKKYLAEYSNKNVTRMPPRATRSVDKLNHKEGVLHGKTDNNTSDSSVSSFENSLILCHNGRILSTSRVDYSEHCSAENVLSSKMRLEHEVKKDGYYYYIFYSDNDYVTNEVHVVFDIYKPTYEYSDYIRGCVNKSECSFPISFMSSDRVIVEIPMKDGIEHEVDDITILESQCVPRTMVYVIFPTATLFVIMCFAFV